MDFALLLAVFVISPTTVLARPTDSDQLNDSEMEDEAKIMFTFPTQVSHGFTVTINGTLKTANKMLKAEFPTDEESTNCTFSYNFETKKMQISPAPEGEEDEIFYDVSDISSDEKPKFSLKLRATKLRGNPMFKLTLNINNVGDSETLTCPIPSFEDFGRIVFKEDVESISSLLFEFTP